MSPLGLNGGHLAEAVGDLLRVEEGERYFGDMKEPEFLELLGWTDRISIAAPSKEILHAGVPSLRRVVKFQDKYMKAGRGFLSYDAGEGTVHILFLLCLAMHQKTPKIFAVENFGQFIDPQLVGKFTQKFCDLVKDHGKIAFLTTHNLSVLDGIDMRDDSVKIFLVERNSTGEVKIRKKR